MRKVIWAITFLLICSNTFGQSEETKLKISHLAGDFYIYTADNIIIWFDKQKILYGGCLIKGRDAENLGYLGDANVTAYYSTLKKVQKNVLPQSSSGLNMV